MARNRQKFDWRMLLLLPIPLIWGLLDHNGELGKLENALLDLRFRYRGEIAAPVKVVYVDFDTRAVQVIGERPWHRGLYAQAAELLLEVGGAKAVGLDFVLSAEAYSSLVNRKEAEAGNLTVARVGQKHPELIYAAQYTQGESRDQDGIRRMPLLRQGFTDREKNSAPEMPVYPIVGATLARSWGTVGLIDVDFEYGADDIPRWVPLFAESATTDFWHMGVQLACVELGLRPGSARRNGNFIELVAKDGAVVRRIPVAEQQLLEINWFTEWASPRFDPHYSLADVLLFGRAIRAENPQERADAEAYFKVFNGAIILMGPVDPLLQDLAPAPFDAHAVPKVGLHGNLLKTIISELYLKRTQPWVMWVSTIALTFAVAGLAVSGGARSLFAKILAALVLTAFTLANFHVFSESHLILPLAAPFGAAFTTGFAATLIQLISEEKQKGRIKGLFGTYLSPELVNQMVESAQDPKLGGHEKVITAYFSDIQSFSTFSELMPASQLVELMNEYLTVCTDIVQEEGGTLDKYIGDAIVAIFGAPVDLDDHAYRACVTSIRVQAAIDGLREKWRGEGEKWPQVVHYLRARLGLNTGQAIIGNMGSRSRFSYTMMGDNVNLAARMESGAKSLGVFTMCTEATKLECEKHGGDRIVFRFLDRIVVKGRTLPVPVYEIAGFRDTVTAKAQECYGVHAEATARYLAQDWDGAAALFERAAALEPHQPNRNFAIQNNPSLIMIDRCHQMKARPPGPKWDGVWAMKEK